MARNKISKDGKTTLVLGATGFLGRHLIDSLSTNGISFVATKRNCLSNEPRFDARSTDAKKQLTEIVNHYKPRVIVDLIAPNVSSFKRGVEADLPGSRYGQILGDVIEALDNCQLIHISTNLLKTRVQDAYTAFKLEVQETLTTQLGSRCSSIDFPRLIGPGDPEGRFVGDLMSCVLQRREFVVNEPERSRDFLNVALGAELITTTCLTYFDEFRNYQSFRVDAERWTNREMSFAIIDSCLRNGLPVPNLKFDSRNQITENEDPITIWKRSVNVSSENYSRLQSMKSVLNVRQAIDRLVESYTSQEVVPGGSPK